MALSRFWDALLGTPPQSRVDASALAMALDGLAHAPELAQALKLMIETLEARAAEAGAAARYGGAAPLLRITSALVLSTPLVATLHERGLLAPVEQLLGCLLRLAAASMRPDACAFGDLLAAMSVEVLAGAMSQVRAITGVAAAAAAAAAGAAVLGDVRCPRAAARRRAAIAAAAPRSLPHRQRRRTHLAHRAGAAGPAAAAATPSRRRRRRRPPQGQRQRSPALPRLPEALRRLYGALQRRRRPRDGASSSTPSAKMVEGGDSVMRSHLSSLVAEAEQPGGGAAAGASLPRLQATASAGAASAYPVLPPNQSFREVAPRSARPRTSPRSSAPSRSSRRRRRLSRRSARASGRRSA